MECSCHFIRFKWRPVSLGLGVRAGGGGAGSSRLEIENYRSLFLGVGVSPSPLQEIPQMRGGSCDFWIFGFWQKGAICRKSKLLLEKRELYNLHGSKTHHFLESRKFPSKGDITDETRIGIEKNRTEPSGDSPEQLCILYGEL